jgi:hypothetical protein
MSTRQKKARPAAGLGISVSVLYNVQSCADAAKLTPLSVVVM